jgi:hypothetical protein
MNKELLDYLRAMALEMSALAEEGNFKLLSHLFSLAALEAGQLIGPTVVFSQETHQETHQDAPQATLRDGAFLPAKGGLDHVPTEPAN